MSKSSQAFRTIREVADWLDVAAHVLRFWESKFPQIKPVKRAGGRRYYRPADMELVGGIKVLLHDRGMTIRGVQKMIREEGVATVSALSPPIDMAEEGGFDAIDADEAMTEAWHETGDDASDSATDTTVEDSIEDAAEDPSEAEEAMEDARQQAQGQEPAGDTEPSDAQDSQPTPPPGPKLSLVSPAAAPATPVAPPQGRQQASLFDFEIDNEEPDEVRAEGTLGTTTTEEPGTPDVTDDVPPGEIPPAEPAESMPAPAGHPASEPEAMAETPPGDPEPSASDAAAMSELLDRLKAARATSPLRLSAMRPALAALCDRMRADPRS
ncbi:MerR family transcriptional regulator [Roseicyclus marinus]|uniref:MerR family transcriptional regulator n=1 Tax=Roseicyclus marinus TaxID=2161673 RepID=UPI0024104EED|nr:MerR family transcriptional regulator [Roseicyclus marinus]MDG3040361.1 MerR family transcriptional regulator [Roseicyclus marinus]